MLELSLHHVSVPTQNLEKSAAFYENVLGLKRIPRPPFVTVGFWFGIGRNQIHVIVNPDASFRGSKTVDSEDTHFALRVEDFEAAYNQVKHYGYDEDFADSHPKKILLKRTGRAGFPQLYVMDPDFNTIEINLAPFEKVAT
ncbi:MAG: VOC family protein [Pseudomonadota bacterium]|nr:VOC family protein [Pseudomonadota bacterium]